MHFSQFIVEVSVKINSYFYLFQTLCTEEGGHLVSITSEADYNKVLCLMVQDLTDRNLYWIGARQQQVNSAE